MRPFSLSLAIVVAGTRCRSSDRTKTPSTSNAVTPGDELCVSVRAELGSLDPHAAADPATRPFPGHAITPSEYRSQHLWRPDTAAVRH
jgi:hypothetical protein